MKSDRELAQAVLVNMLGPRAVVTDLYLQLVAVGKDEALYWSAVETFKQHGVKTKTVLAELSQPEDGKSGKSPMSDL